MIEFNQKRVFLLVWTVILSNQKSAAFYDGSCSTSYTIKIQAPTFEFTYHFFINFFKLSLIIQINSRF